MESDSGTCKHCGEEIYLCVNAWLHTEEWVHQRRDSVACPPTFAAPAPATAVASEVDMNTLNEIEATLLSIADGASPQEAIGKVFNIINRERASRCGLPSPPQ